jgi:hypothetical protein
MSRFSTLLRARCFREGMCFKPFYGGFKAQLSSWGWVGEQTGNLVGRIGCGIGLKTAGACLLPGA